MRDRMRELGDRELPDGQTIWSFFNITGVLLIIL